MPEPTPRASRAQNPIRVLSAHRNFRLFWIGQTVSLVGSWMQSVSVGWLALQLTDSAFMVGLAAAAGALPVLLLSLYGGVFADRHDKLRIVTVAQVLLITVAVLLWWFAWSGRMTIGWLLALGLIAGTVNAFEIPARQSLIIELVGREDLTSAIALNSGGFNLARVVGPSIAGVVIQHFGVAACFAVNAVSFLAVLVGLSMVRLPYRPTRTAVGSSLGGLREGLAYLRTSRELSALMRLIAVFAVLGAPYLALMPVIARDVLRAGAGGYGLLFTCVGVGGVVGAIALATVGQRIRRGEALAFAAYAFAVTLLAFALSRSLALSAALLLAVGFFMIVNNALSNSALQVAVPDALRGRVMAAYAWVVVGLGPVVGPLLAGSLAKVAGAAATVVACGVALLLYAHFAFSKRPELLRT